MDDRECPTCNVLFYSPEEQCGRCGRCSECCDCWADCGCDDSEYTAPGLRLIERLAKIRHMLVRSDEQTPLTWK